MHYYTLGSVVMLVLSAFTNVEQNGIVIRGRYLMPEVADNGTPPDNDPLHGVTLRMMVEKLQSELGWSGLADKIHIKCFDVDPSVDSSLKFLRRTAWAREKVELLYLYVFHKKKAGELAIRRREGKK